MAAGTDYQTATLQVMWFANAHTVSDGVRCYPSPYPLNRYNVLSPVKDLKVTLPAKSSRVVLAAYQLAVYSETNGQFHTRMYQNNQQLRSTGMRQGYAYYLNLNSLWMNYLTYADYEFGLTYRNYYKSYFEDCRNSYQGNKNLYAMYLPQACRIMTNMQRITFPYNISTTSWINTDLSYSFTLYQTTHMIVRYQYISRVYYTSLITRLSIDDTVHQQTAAVTGNTYNIGQSGMWQGVLSSGMHNITVQIKSGNGTTNRHYVYTQAMDIVYCY